MNVQLSPLSCLGYFVTDLVITANPKHNPDKPAKLNFNDLQIDCKTEKPEEDVTQKEKLWRVWLQINQNVSTGKNSPYNFMISLHGQFIVHPKYSKDKAKKLVSINGCSLLYTTARTVLCSAMSHGPFRPLILPTVCFLEESSGIVAKSSVSGAAKVSEKPKKYTAKKRYNRNR